MTEKASKRPSIRPVSPEAAAFIAEAAPVTAAPTAAPEPATPRKAPRGRKPKAAAEPAPAPDARAVMLIVDGHLKNRSETSSVMMLFLKNTSAQWMEAHAISGRGGAQILINYLVARGIAAIEAEYAASGAPVIVRE